MDKRTVLALALVAIVIIITPKIFPTAAPPARAPVTAPSDTGQGDDTARTESAVTAAEPETPAPAPPRIVADSPAPVVAESTVVRDAVAEYLFTNQGAAPQQVTLLGYRALNRSERNVTLTSGTRPLLSYRLLGVTDTVALGTIPFQVTQETTAQGTPLLSYRGAAGDGRTVEIRYTMVPDSFVLRVEGSVTAEDPRTAPSYLLIDLPSTFASFEADSADDQNHFAFAIKPKLRNAEGISFRDLDPGERKLVQGPLAWAAAKSKYFIVGILTADSDDSFAEAITVGGPRTSKAATVANGTVVARLNNGSFRFEVFAGPQQYQRLQSMGREFENSNPYGGFMQGVVQPFATLVMKILLWMRATLKLDYGWLLIIFGVAVRLVLWPLNHGAMRTSMRMQRIQPELNDIQKRYKSDPQTMQAEMMRVYKEHGMSPFSTFAGCLPLLLPMPVLFALFFVFQNTIEFRGVPFLWLADISLKDPYYIIPLLMGASMFLLSWIGMRNMPPNPQTKVMLYVFPVMMTFLFANFASGLNMYYAVQNLAALPQQWLIANERAKQANTNGGGGKKPAKG